MAKTRSYQFPAIAAVSLLGILFCRSADAQRDFLFEEVLPPETPKRNTLEMGVLSSGARSGDLDEKIFLWDYVTYFDYRFRLNDKDRLRLRHLYWDFIDGNYRNVYEIGLRHRLKDNRALSIAADFIDERYDYESGALYLGYQDLLGKDFLYYIQGGGGLDSDHEWHGSLYLEALKPLTRSTLLRLRNEYVESTSDYRSNTFRINLIQALHRRLALNLGYRLFANRQADESRLDLESELIDAPGDLTSHMGSAALVYQLREDLFLTGEYRYYNNSADVEANTYGLETRWMLSDRYALVGGYQLQDYIGGPVNHGFRLGVSISF